MFSTALVIADFFKFILPLESNVIQVLKYHKKELFVNILMFNHTVFLKQGNVHRNSFYKNRFFK